MFFYCDTDHYLPDMNATTVSVYCILSDNDTKTWIPLVTDTQCIGKYYKMLLQYYSSTMFPMQWLLLINTTVMNVIV